MTVSSVLGVNWVSLPSRNVTRATPPVPVRTASPGSQSLAVAGRGECATACGDLDRRVEQCQNRTAGLLSDGLLDPDQRTRGNELGDHQRKR